MTAKVDRQQKTGFRILIVEDEFIIADSIERNLRRRGHHIVGKAISYEEAVELYAQQRPELVLIDIRLSGTRTGIDIANYLNQLHEPPVFLYLTSQLDTETLEMAKVTLPAGYLSKPIQMNTLHSTIEVTMHNRLTEREVNSITLPDGRSNHVVPIGDIRYLQADHVYVHVHLVDRPSLVLRTSLSDLLNELPQEQFVQTHRSFVVNLQHITSYKRKCLHIDQQQIPVSRSRRDAVLQLL